MAARWIERRFEWLIWKFRLISILPMVLSLLGSVGCFVIGAIEESNAFLVIMRVPLSPKCDAAKTITQMVGATDLLALCGSVAILALSASLLFVATAPNPNTDSDESDKTQT